jgi:prevent-host-death family protein
MHTVGSFEAKTHFSALLERVERGEQIAITKHGRLVAKLVPATGPDRDKRRKVIQRLREFGRHNTLGGLDWKALRDEGRH